MLPWYMSSTMYVVSATRLNAGGGGEGREGRGGAAEDRRLLKTTTTTTTGSNRNRSCLDPRVELLFRLQPVSSRLFSN